MRYTVVLFCFFAACGYNEPSVVAEEKTPDALIAIRNTGGTKYAVAVVNLSDRPILLGALHSALGDDQFLFKVRTSGGMATIQRIRLPYSRDGRQPVSVPSGSYREFAIDFADRTWALGDRTTKSWKAIMVVYQPAACIEVKERTRKGIFGARLESKWIKIRSAGKR